MAYLKIDYTEMDNGLLLWSMMWQNHQNYYEVNAKIQKKSLGNDSSDSTKSCF